MTTINQLNNKNLLRSYNAVYFSITYGYLAYGDKITHVLYNVDDKKIYVLKEKNNCLTNTADTENEPRSAEFNIHVKMNIAIYVKTF